ncbi:hypothetical protein JQW92_03030 [Sulfitobacter pseudonitzschiae]|uniref:hypothetical protein n=1 Tax=Pseudosulfitobacter pseudonitzschiae TaxID=1402135 RepID=UPI001AF204EC|nr:hypothetical protein [Pseudosulfitobacter pseudonitzschiae]MBM1814029.1 hypothetical protein [Pseudosulfitobacter pseudonitzschiae]MBM1831022.1 hypothetical protein [Pseudosulfitobacter pseudonitzschiae]MBM1835889.1 hypothetical protein [Pseudosulfitobacter pseudonitzschiae]MBM1840735.1 hypothetical protein [Pseudosulfitobacter pseudonitzschiae]MBM1845277.1 hypothetical protein [Pseudosulfitobacter pseudonitzschiae]
MSPTHIGEMQDFGVLNDSRTGGSHAERPYNKRASDRGRIMAHLALGQGDEG